MMRRRGLNQQVVVQPRYEKRLLCLDEFHWATAFFVIIRHVTDPGAYRIASHDPTLHHHQNSKSIENCNCLGMLALLGVANTEMGELSTP
jgi:hypothetical protein